MKLSFSKYPLFYFVKKIENYLCKTRVVPREIMLEVTDKCNLNCNFCFNKLRINQRGIAEDLSTENIKKIIDKISTFAVKIVRFTGGEPLLRKDIFELMEYAYEKGLKVWLNTNATLITKGNVCKIVKYVDNILIPLNAYDVKGEYEVTGYRHFKKKTKRNLSVKKIWNKISPLRNSGY